MCCLQCIWWVFALFAVSTTGCWANPVFLGPLFLSLLFLGSTWITEKITTAKYPAYKVRTANKEGQGGA